jgi:hypothetical protein
MSCAAFGLQLMGFFSGRIDDGSGEQTISGHRKVLARAKFRFCASSAVMKPSRSVNL